MTHVPFRRRQQPAFRGDFTEDHAVTEVLKAAAPAPWDGDTYEFTGASGAGLGPDNIYAAPAPAAVRQPGPDTGPLAAYRDRRPAPESFPVLRARPAARYAAEATGPQPVTGRERPAIGDALTHDEQWGPKLIPLPCGHCGTPPDIPAGVLERTRIIGYVNHLAWNAGWVYDIDLIWTCPACQQDETWQGRQGQLEVYRGGVTCQRNHLGYPDGDCTCPGAVLAVDAMLTSEDYLGSGRGRHAGGAR